MKRGDWVKAWDDDEDDAVETRYLSEIEGASIPHVCVNEFFSDLEAFERGWLFDITHWKHVEPVEDFRRDGIVNGTRVLVWGATPRRKRRRHATGEWINGEIVCWVGGCDEWSSFGAKRSFPHWERAWE